MGNLLSRQRSHDAASTSRTQALPEALGPLSPATAWTRRPSPNGGSVPRPLGIEIRERFIVPFYFRPRKLAVAFKAIKIR